jgi:hypothetical protein
MPLIRLRRYHHHHLDIDIADIFIRRYRAKWVAKATHFFLDLVDLLPASKLSRLGHRGLMDSLRHNLLLPGYIGEDLDDHLAKVWRGLVAHPNLAMPAPDRRNLG